jgi:hypothetical protein
MTQLARPLWAMALLLAVGGPAAAESYCVACYGPDAVYRCVIAGAAAGAPADPRHQVQCIKHLAKGGGHARCSVERFSVEGCTGPERVIDPATSTIPLAPGAAETEAARPTPAIPPAAGPPLTGDTPTVAKPDAASSEPPAGPAAPPRTVEELAKTTVENTKKSIDDVTGTVKQSTEKAGDQIQGFGSAVGNAAKKSWDCMMSLFSDC